MAANAVGEDDLIGFSYRTDARAVAHDVAEHRTDGPVEFHRLGGGDIICVNDTGLASGSGEVGIFGESGDDTVYNFAEDVEVVVRPGPGTNAFYGSPGSEVLWVDGSDVIETGGGADTVLDLGGSGTIGDGDDWIGAYDEDQDFHRRRSRL